MRARFRFCLGVRTVFLLSLLPAVGGAAPLGSLPAVADTGAHLTAQMDQHMCRMNKMHRECVARAVAIQREPRGGSDAYRETGSAIGGMAIPQCQAIQAQIERYRAECLASAARDPNYPIDCAVFLRRDWPPGAC